MSMAMASCGGKRGRVIVLVLALAGLGLGLISLSYRRHHARELEETIVEDAAGSVPWDRAAAERELAGLQSRVETALESDRAQEVRREAERFVERYPGYAAGYTLLGQVLLGELRHGEAYEQIKLSLELDPAQAEVHLLAGTLCMQLQRSSDAERHYRQAVGLDPANVQLRLHLAQSYIEQQRFDEARRDLVRLLMADSSLHSAAAMLADMAMMQNKLTLAMNYIARAIENTPIAQRERQVIYIRRKARILRRQNKPDEALQTLEEQLGGLERRDPEVLEEMAHCWSAQGQYQPAAMLFEAALERSPTDWRLAAGAARWWIKADQTAKAELNLARIRQIDPRQPVVAELEATLSRNE